VPPSARQPEQVVQEYFGAFRARDKPAMLSCLSDVFFDEFKAGYLMKVESYDKEKLEVALKILGVEPIEKLRAMSGKEIFVSFLDSPLSGSYWKGYDSPELIVDVERIEISAAEASVRSWIYTKRHLPVKGETVYSLTNRGGEWLIDRFKKKLHEPLSD
jgi:hypothetical protein